jgi:hypothetical protein
MWQTRRLRLVAGWSREIYFEGTILVKLLVYHKDHKSRSIDKFTGKEGLFENSPFDERTRQIVAKQNATRDFDRQRVSGYRSSIYTIFKSDDSF